MSDLSFLEQRTIQMEYVVPLIKDLQEVLGSDFVLDALEKVNQLRMARAEQERRVNLEEMDALLAFFSEGGALDYDVIARSSTNFDVNIKHCKFAEMMERLGGREFGHLLICNSDFQLAKTWGMDLQRTQTRMQGAQHCDFRYRRIKTS